jgi:hypothetical protein
MESFESGGQAMSRLGVLTVASLAVLIFAPDAMARGAVSGGVRGAMVGGMVGGQSGAATGAKIGAVAGATRGAAERAQDRGAMDAEAEGRIQYENTPAYQTAQRSNFNDAPPDIMVSSPATGAPAPGGEAIVRKGDKPVVGITYPSDWTQKTGGNYVTAVSRDGQAWSVLATLDGIKDRQAGIDQIKQKLDKYLTNIDYDDLTETERGALMVTGTGKSKKSGVDVVFAGGVFDAGGGQYAGTAFVVDKGVEDHYKEAVRYTCQTIKGEQDLAR